MANFYEIDFLDVETSKSGDAIVIRYEIDGVQTIHVVDGGYQKTGESLVAHINSYYGKPKYIDHIVVTHPDGDHCGGLRSILETFTVGKLWMLRPWIHADALLPHFTRFRSSKNLADRLREIYPNLVALEELAVEKGVEINEPWQGTAIGAFTVLTPTYDRWVTCLLDSDRTPEVSQAVKEERIVEGVFERLVAKAIEFIKSAWGDENFSAQPTSAENEMSVIQVAILCGEKIMLTGDAGRAALREAIDFAPGLGFPLPGIDRFQVPHHGARRNVTTELLDELLGPRLKSQPADLPAKFTAFISSAKADEHHPRKSVVRACIHRGGKVITTEGRTVRTSRNAPSRDGWTSLQGEPYPTEQEK